MPQGVYRKKIKSGKRKGDYMHFRNGKLISKASYDRSKSSKKRSTRKGMIRKTSRRAYTKVKRGNNKMRKSIPHPSVTGMASGLAIASYLNAGGTTSFGGKSVQLDGVIKDVTDGELGKAFSTLSGNAIDMIGSDKGRKTLVGASLVAMAGAFARKQFPNLKLGGSKLYFRL
tara:strand:- start:585 stop:1100 length:516 start_codon:yes stop_codon:yes gene_type:complete